MSVELPVVIALIKKAVANGSSGESGGGVQMPVEELILDFNMPYKKGTILYWNGFIVQANEDIEPMGEIVWGLEGPTWRIVNYNFKGIFDYDSNYKVNDVVVMSSTRSAVYLCVEDIEHLGDATNYDPENGNRQDKWLRIINGQVAPFKGSYATHSGRKGLVPAPQWNVSDAKLLANGTWDTSGVIAKSRILDMPEDYQITVDELNKGECLEIAQYYPDITFTLPTTGMDEYHNRRILITNIGIVNINIKYSSTSSIIVKPKTSKELLWVTGFGNGWFRVVNEDVEDSGDNNGVGGVPSSSRTKILDKPTTYYIPRSTVDLAEIIEIEQTSRDVMFILPAEGPTLNNANRRLIIANTGSAVLYLAKKDGHNPTALAHGSCREFIWVTGLGWFDFD